ncbi:PKD domain-containing protein, partial [Candidatus Bipolaricaulota bacterium]|nr:PKD domain-containing protein [Candidatus Bipolaricaulota bacterium]
SVVLIGMLAGCSLFNEAPTVNFEWTPAEPLTRMDVSFRDLSIDSGGLFGGGGIVGWLWDFGDGQSSSSKDPKHEYDSGGTYDVRLTVTDDAGATASLTRKITVSPSLAGTWTGLWTDTNWNTFSLILTLNHTSVGGSISGTVSHNGQIWPIIGGSFNSTTMEIQITASDTILRGTLDPSERRMSGTWYESTIGWAGEDWSASLP